MIIAWFKRKRDTRRVHGNPSPSPLLSHVGSRARATGGVEHEIAWVPYFLDRLDYTYTQRARRAHWVRYRTDALPSDFFRRSVFLSFQEDEMGIRDRALIGVDTLMWGSDYPHTESTFPRSRAILERILDGVPGEERRQITASNAARLYRFDPVPAS